MSRHPRPRRLRVGSSLARHLGLFIPPHIELGRSILRGLGACALSRPDWLLWGIPEAWEQSRERLPVELDAAVAFMGHPQAAEWLGPWHPRVINLSNRFDFPGFSRVVTDDAAVGRLAARHLVDRGYRQFVAAHLDAAFGQIRAHSFRKALLDSGIRDEAIRVLTHEAIEDLRGDRHGMRSALRGLDLPAAIFADSDWLAQRIRRACYLEGIEVPGEVAILGVDDDPVWSQLGSPPLSSIALDGKRIAEEVVTLLDDGFKSGRWPRREVLVPPLALVERQSSEASAGRDPIVRKAFAWIAHHAILGEGIPELCTALGVTRRTLDRHFEANGGVSPLDLILRRRLEHARRMLRETDEKIDEVAFRSGFGTARSLSRAFVAAESESPSAYRARFAR